METRTFLINTRVALLNPYNNQPIGYGRVTTVAYDDPMRYGVTLDDKNKPEPEVQAEALRPIDE